MPISPDLCCLDEPDAISTLPDAAVADVPVKADTSPLPPDSAESALRIPILPLTPDPSDVCEAPLFK